MGIMAAFAAVTIPQMSQFNKDQSLPQTADALQETFRVAQANATSGRQCQSDTSTAWYAQLTGANGYNIGSSCTSTTPTPTPTPTLSSVKVVDVDMSGPTADICHETANFAGMGVSFQNITGAVSFMLGSSTDCSAIQMASATKMTITLQQGTDTTKQARVAIGKGGSINVLSQ